MAVRAMTRRNEVIEEPKITKASIKEIVDQAFGLQEEIRAKTLAFKESIKDTEDRLEAHKITIKKYAKETNKHQLDGVIAKCKISDVANPPEISPKTLWTFLKKQNKTDLFFKLTKVMISEARTYLGQVTLDSIAATTYKKFDRLSISRK